MRSSCSPAVRFFRGSRLPSRVSGSRGCPSRVAERSSCGLDLDEGAGVRARGEADDGPGVEGLVAGGQIEVDRVAVDVEELGTGLRFVARQYGHAGTCCPMALTRHRGGPVRAGTGPCAVAYVRCAAFELPAQGLARALERDVGVRVGQGGCAGGGCGRAGGVLRGPGVVLDQGTQVAGLLRQVEVAAVGVVEVAHFGAQRPGVDGLHDEVGDAEPEGRGGQYVVCAEAGEQDDRYVLGLFHAAHVADHVQAADAGHADVQQQQADLSAEHLLEGLVAVRGAAQQIAQRGQGALQGVQGVLVVVHDEDLGFRHGPSSLPRGQPAYVEVLTWRARRADKECTAQHAP